MIFLLRKLVELSGQLREPIQRANPKCRLGSANRTATAARRDRAAALPNRTFVCAADLPVAHDRGCSGLGVAENAPHLACSRASNPAACQLLAACCLPFQALDR